jgi:hypothetical protein
VKFSFTACRDHLNVTMRRHPTVALRREQWRPHRGKADHRRQLTCRDHSDRAEWEISPASLPSRDEDGYGWTTIVVDRATPRAHRSRQPRPYHCGKPALDTTLSDPSCHQRHRALLWITSNSSRSLLAGDRTSRAGRVSLAGVAPPAWTVRVSASALSGPLLSRTSPPAQTGLSHWFSREMTKHLKRREEIAVAHVFVANLWREHGLNRHRQDTCTVPRAHRRVRRCRPVGALRGSRAGSE